MTSDHDTITLADAAAHGSQVMTECVYFVRIGKHIKIGFTKDIAKRVKSFLTTAAGVEVLLTIPGGRDLERQFHYLLAEQSAYYAAMVADRKQRLGW